jgi:hypothetical protein
MGKNLKPFPVVLLGSVIALILAVAAYPFMGEAGLLGTALVLNVAVGLAVSLRWPLNPWRIGVIAVIPSIAFLLWRWITRHTTPEDVTLNTTLFIFLPVIAIATSYFGGYIGRSIVIRRMKQAALQNK